MDAFRNLLFPSSSLVNFLSLMFFARFSYGGFAETRGVHFQFSKFVDADSPPTKKKKINTKVEETYKLSSKMGMLLSYTPALLASLASFLVIDLSNLRCLLLSLAFTIHFLKRVLEVLFLHKYSGNMVLSTAFNISIGYFFFVVMATYDQYLTIGIKEPAYDLKLVGIVLYIIGIFGNSYHHYLLSKLREKDDVKAYKIPKGGLFSIVVCPHYFCEIIEFFGIAFISQTVTVIYLVLGSMFYLMGRSYATRKWYQSKFDEFPSKIKALIPYVF